jgi:hypothetical protein
MPIAGEVLGEDGPRAGRDEIRVGSGIGKRAVAVVQVHVEPLPVVLDEREVGRAVLVEVAGHDAERAGRGRGMVEDRRGEEVGRAVIDEQGGAPGIGDDDVEVAVAIEVGRGRAVGVVGKISRDGHLKGAVAVAERHDELLPVGIGDEDIELVVAVDVGDMDVERRADWDVAPGSVPTGSVVDVDLHLG